MKKKHGLTVTLASLSAATASIVTGAFVSQSATASSDTPARATVTMVAATDGGQPFRCTFDDVTLPEVDATSGADAPHLTFAGGATAVSATAGPEGEPGITTAAPDGATVHVFTSEDARDGTAEECAALRASVPDGLPMPVPGGTGAGTDGPHRVVGQGTVVVGGTARTN